MHPVRNGHTLLEWHQIAPDAASNKITSLTASSTTMSKSNMQYNEQDLHLNHINQNSKFILPYHCIKLKLSNYCHQVVVVVTNL